MIIIIWSIASQLVLTFAKVARLCQAVFFNHSVGWSWLVNRWFNRLIGSIGRSIVGLIDWCFRYRSYNHSCKTVNLITNTLGWSRDAQRERKKSGDLSHADTTDLRRSEKHCAFGKTLKRCSIDSTPQIELSCTKAICRGHRVRSRAGVTWRGVACRG